METSLFQARRIGDRCDAGARRVLIALDDFKDAGLLAGLFAARGVLPTLVVSCDQLVREAREKAYGLVVVHASFLCNHDSRCLRELQEARFAPLLTVGILSEQQDDGVDLALDSHADLEEVAVRGTGLIEMRRPVRLPECVRWGPLELDMARHEARWQGDPIRLTVLEFRIMEVLSLAVGSTVGDEQLSRRVWNTASFEDRARLVAHVRRIRQKIEDDPSSPRFLLRVRGRGFRLAEPPVNE